MNTEPCNDFVGKLGPPDTPEVKCPNCGWPVAEHPADDIVEAWVAERVEPDVEPDPSARIPKGLRGDAP